MPGLVIPEGAQLCQCEGVKPKESKGHCCSVGSEYVLSRSQFVVNVMWEGKLVGRKRLDNLNLCGPCGREYADMGYPVHKLRVSDESGRLGLPANGRQAT